MIGQGTAFVIIVCAKRCLFATFWLHFVLELVAVASAIPTYQPTNGTFVSADFMVWLRSHADSGQKELAIAPGSYVCTPPGPNDPAHVVFRDPLADMILHMEHVDLVMPERQSTAVHIQNWANVTLRGLTIRYKIHPTNQAQIVDISSDGLAYTVDVCQGYPLQDWEAAVPFSCNVFDRNTLLWKPGTSDLYPTDIIHHSDNHMRYTMHFPHDVGPAVDNVAPGDYLGCRQPAGKFGFVVQGCLSSVFADVTLFGAPSFAFFHTYDDAMKDTQDGGEDNSFQHVRVLAPEMPAGASVLSLLSASADGFHVAGVGRGPSIVDSYFERMPDDGIALHGKYVVAVGILHDNKTGQKNVVLTKGYPINVGDRFNFYDGQFFPRTMAAKVTSVHLAPDGYVPVINVSRTMPQVTIEPPYDVITTQPEVADLQADWVATDVNRVPHDFHILRNTIVDHRARGILIKGSDGVIEGNVINGSTMGGIIVTPELSWAEADCSHNIAIVNNTIVNIGYGKQSYGGIAVGALDPDHKLVPAALQQNIHIANNTLRDIDYNNIWISSSSNVTVEYNNIYSPYSHSQWATCCPPYPLPDGVVVWMTQSSALSVHDNCVFNPGSTTRSIFNVTESTHGHDLTDGVKLCS